MKLAFLIIAFCCGAPGAYMPNLTCSCPCSKRMFDEHISMLSEKMAKKAARQEQMRLEREAKRRVGIPSLRHATL